MVTAAAMGNRVIGVILIIVVVLLDEPDLI
jgi:hypothetical protein